MPIERVPVVHRFGIISHSQRVDLQQRLIEQTFAQYTLTKKPPTANQYLLEVTDEFIQQHNWTETVTERDKLNEKANKILERIKRRVGLKTDGIGAHVNLPTAWTELVLLAQCSGRIQKDCLHVLLTSLERSPVSTIHITALFFLAETALYWLQAGDMGGGVGGLAPGWGVRLRIGMAVFVRLFHHHMTGQLVGCKSFKNRLFAYLQGLEEHLLNFEAHPDALVCLQYIGDVGLMIVGDNNTESGEVKEGDQAAVIDPEDAALLSNTVHDLCPTLWHSLDVWRCVRSFGAAGLHSALTALACCGANMAADSWVDAICVLQVLGDAARLSLPTLQVLQHLACGHLPPRRPSAGTPRSATTDFERATSHEDTSLDDITNNITTHDAANKQTACHVPEVSRVTETRDGETRVDTGKMAEYGTTMGRQREEEVTMPITFTNVPAPGVDGLRGWHWEVAMTYVHVMEDLCLHGATSEIQKVALVGSQRNIEKTEDASSESPLRSAGLLDLISFQTVDAIHDGGASDWGWRVRYSAMTCVSRLCAACAHDSTRSGVTTVGWSALVRAKSLERDRRVLDAIAAATAASPSHKETLQVSPPTLGGRIATSLASLYLPSVPPVRLVSEVSQRPPVLAPLTTIPPAPDKPVVSRPRVPRGPIRTTLRQEIDLANAFYQPAVDFKTRMNFDLRRVVEDQWRKECHERMNVETRVPPSVQVRHRGGDSGKQNSSDDKGRATHRTASSKTNNTVVVKKVSTKNKFEQTIS